MLIQYYVSLCVISEEKCGNNFKGNKAIKYSKIDKSTVAIFAFGQINMVCTLVCQPQKQEEIYGGYDDGKVEASSGWNFF